MVKPNDVIGYDVSSTQGCTPKNIQKNIFTRGIVLEDVLKMFAKKTMVELVELPSRKHLDKIAIASTIDLEANEIIHTLIQGNIKDLKNLKPVNGKIIKPLYLFLDKEVLLYAKLKKLKFKKEAVRSSLLGKNVGKISIFINKLEKKHPEVKRAIVNSYLGLC